MSVFVIQILTEATLPKKPEAGSFKVVRTKRSDLDDPAKRSDQTPAIMVLLLLPVVCSSSRQQPIRSVRHRLQKQQRKQQQWTQLAPRNQPTLMRPSSIEICSAAGKTT